jgi:hypothetical protein
MRNADQLIGARIEAGVIVNAKGNAKAVMTGAVVAELAGSRERWRPRWQKSVPDAGAPRSER